VEVSIIRLEVLQSIEFLSENSLKNLFIDSKEAGSKSSIAEEEENRKKSQVLIIECRPELLMSESKFLQLDSLLELVKVNIYIFH